MKRAVALILMVATFVFILASCGGDSLSGEYVFTKDGVETTLKFDGDKVTTSVKVVDEAVKEELGEEAVALMEISVNGTFEIKDDKITITIDGKAEESTYKKDGDKITIAGDEYTKK